MSSVSQGNRLTVDNWMNDDTLYHLDAAFAAARARVPSFVSRHFGILGSLWLHRHVFGPDLIVAPINLFMSAPALFARMTAMILRLLRLQRLPEWIDRIPFFLPTRSGRELEAQLRADLLQDTEIAKLIGQRAPERGVDFQARVDRLIAEYMAARTAFAEFAAALVVFAAGVLVYGGVTPGAFTLAPYVAHEYSQLQAAENFLLGQWAGSVWYDYFPTETDWSLILKTAGLIMLAMAFLASLIGVVIDPIQRFTRLHHYRLNRLVAASAHAAMGDRAKGLRLADTFLPRFVDVIETAIIMLRIGPY